MSSNYKNIISFAPLLKSTEEWQSWFIAPVLKTDVGNTTGGSNPSSSAKGVNFHSFFHLMKNEKLSSYGNVWHKLGF